MGSQIRKIKRNQSDKSVLKKIKKIQKRVDKRPLIPLNRKEDQND